MRFSVEAQYFVPFRMASGYAKAGDTKYCVSNTLFNRRQIHLRQHAPYAAAAVLFNGGYIGMYNS